MRDAGCDGWMGDAQHWDGLGLGFLGWAGVTSWSVGQGPESQVRVQGKDKGKDKGKRASEAGILDGKGERWVLWKLPCLLPYIKYPCVIRIIST